MIKIKHYQLKNIFNFISSIDNDEQHLTASENENMEIMISDEADEVFDLLKKKYQNNLESMKGSDFVFDQVQLLYYKCHKINLSRRG